MFGIQYKTTTPTKKEKKSRNKPKGNPEISVDFKIKCGL